MSFKSSVLLTGIVILTAFQLKGQSFAETALLFSRTTPGGSARIQSLGGAQISLGADYSTALSNPAGLGMYNRSEFTISPGLNLAQSTSSFSGEKTKGSKTTFYIPGLALAFHNDYEKLSGFLGGTFSIAFNRVNDFNRNIKYQGTNSNSIIDFFIEDASGSTVNQFDPSGALFNTPTELAFNNFLIGPATDFDPSLNPADYFSYALGNPSLQEEIQTRGAQNQWSFSYGVNLNDKLFLGAGLGVNTLRFESKKTYSENFAAGPVIDLRLEENLEIRGSGVNATFGAIYRPIDILQFGISGTTPTHYELSDTYSATMSSTWDNFQYFQNDPSIVLNSEQVASDVLTSDYGFNMPWKVSAGATIFLEKKGFLSIDAERVNYASAKYNSITQGVSFDGDNQDIRSLYQAVYNIRAGAEYRVNSFSFRGGYAFMPEPFASEQNAVSQKITRLSGGAGYRTANFYIDLALIYSTGEAGYRPYTINSIASPLVKNNLKNTNIVFTVGFPF